MRSTAIAATLGLLTFAATAAAQSPGWGYGPGYGPGYGAGYGSGRPAMEQPAGRPARGRRGGWFCEQGDRDPAERIAFKLERMSARLGLTDAQKPQIEAIMKEQHARRVAQRKETHDRILSLLDEEQRARAEQFMARRCQGRGGRSGPGAGPGRGWGGGPGMGYGPGGGYGPGAGTAPVQTPAATE